MVAISTLTASPHVSHARIQTDNNTRLVASRQEAIYDAGLVKRFNTGDETAFVEIIARHKERMFSVAFSMLKNRSDAEEIAQDTFIRAHRGLAEFRGDSSLSTWLHRITRNLAHNRYWYFFRRCRHTTLSLDCSLNDDGQATFSDLLAADIADPMREAMSGEFSRLIIVCMQRLDDQPREILTMRNSLNYSYGEIARKLGINVGTVKSRISRARRNLRSLLAEACPEFDANAEPFAWFNPIRPAGGIQVICA